MALLLGTLPVQGKFGRTYNSLKLALEKLTDFTDLRKEFIDVLEMLSEKSEQITSLGKPLLPISEIPLKVHSRYSRDEILSAFGESTIEKRHNLVAGVFFCERYNTDLLFITLKKEDKDFLPSHQYADYPIDKDLFHWESQSRTTSQVQLAKDI